MRASPGSDLQDKVFPQFPPYWEQADTVGVCPRVETLEKDGFGNFSVPCCPRLFFISSWRSCFLNTRAHAVFFFHSLPNMLLLNNFFSLIFSLSFFFSVFCLCLPGFLGRRPSLVYISFCVWFSFKTIPSFLIILIHLFSHQRIERCVKGLP